MPAKPYCTCPRRRGWKHHLEPVPLDGQVQRRWQRAVAARAARCRCDSVVLSPRRVYRPQQHQEPYCLRLKLLLNHLGRPIKGN